MSAYFFYLTDEMAIVVSDMQRTKRDWTNANHEYKVDSDSFRKMESFGNFIQGVYGSLELRSTISKFITQGDINRTIGNILTGLSAQFAFFGETKYRPIPASYFYIGYNQLTNRYELHTVGLGPNYLRYARSQAKPNPFSIGCIAYDCETNAEFRKFILESDLVTIEKSTANFKEGNIDFKQLIKSIIEVYADIIKNIANHDDFSQYVNDNIDYVVISKELGHIPTFRGEKKDPLQ